jgi:ubiquinone/menaquinone biosynthesis C-methylase UbiE
MDHRPQITPQVSADHYNARYDSKRRFISYWYQIHEITTRAQGPVLEIGVGNGMVSSYLRRQNIELTTIDYDSELKPDVVGDIQHLPFQNDIFDLVAAYEVLEHLPYEQSLTGLKEIHRVTKRLAVISLPDSAHFYSIEMRVPFVGIVRTSLRLEWFGKEKSSITQHYWELGLQQYRLARIRKDIERIGFCIEKEYSIFENPRHYFFILKKI